LTKEKNTLDGDITKLRDGLSNNTTTQSVDNKTGQVITRANNANRKSFETQLSQAQVRRDTIAKRIDNMNDSITKLDVDILNMESEEISGSELGALKYVSELLEWNIKRVANLFILILIFVFDPLAITLVIATNQAFKGKRKKDDYTVNTPEYTVVTPQVTPQVTEQVPTEHRTSTEQVDVDESDKLNPTQELLEYLEKVLDENYKVSEITNETPIKPTEEELLKLENLLLEKEENKEEEKIEEFVVEKNQTQESKPKKLSYLNRDGYGKSLRINRF